jgi:hypothetical protein
MVWLHTSSYVLSRQIPNIFSRQNRRAVLAGEMGGKSLRACKARTRRVWHIFHLLACSTDDGRWYKRTPYRRRQHYPTANINMSGRGRSTSGGSGRSQGRGGGRGGRGSSNVGGGRGGGGGSGGRRQQQRQTNVRSAPPTPMKYRSTTNPTTDDTNATYAHSRAVTPASYSNNNNKSNSSRSSLPRGRTSLFNNNTSTAAAASAAAAHSSKRDGERGASAHTVSEQYRIQLTQLLMNFRETSTDDDQDSITLPSNLTNTQRKFVHELSKQLGLKSKSYGKGEERKVVVSKILSGGGGGLSGIMMGGNVNARDGSSSSRASSLSTWEEHKQVPRINVGKSGEEALRKHMTKFPPSMEEGAESRETGSSFLLHKNSNAYEQNDAQTRDDFDVAGDDDTVGHNGVLDDEVALLTLNNSASTLLAQTSEQSRQQADLYRRKQKQHHTKMLQMRMQHHAVSQQQTRAHPQYTNMMKQRRNLPAFQYAQDICNVLRNKKNQVVILTGDTGCGYVHKSLFFIHEIKSFSYDHSPFAALFFYLPLGESLFP